MSDAVSGESLELRSRWSRQWDGAPDLLTPAECTAALRRTTTHVVIRTRWSRP